MRYVNGEGRVAFPDRWNMAGEFNRFGYAQVLKGSTMLWIDRTGRVAKPLPDAQIGKYQDEKDMYWTYTNNRMGGRQFQEEPQLTTTQNGPWGELDHTGRVVVAPQWGDRPHADSELARVMHNHLWGYMDRLGNWAIPPQWTFAGDFDSAGLACVERDNLWGFIDPTGKAVIPVIYQTSSEFDQQGLACVRKDNSYGFIDRTGSVVIPLECGLAYGFAGQPMAKVRRKGGWGGIDRHGRLIVDCRWDRFTEIHDQGQLYTLFSEQATQRHPWLQNLVFWTRGSLERLLPGPSIRNDLYDSEGHLVWSSTWKFASWATWIMIAAGCVLLFDLVRWARSRRVPPAVA